VKVDIEFVLENYDQMRQQNYDLEAKVKELEAEVDKVQM